MTLYGTGDETLYADASITLVVTPDADLSSANAIRAYIIDSDGNRTQWGSDQGGVAAGTEVTATDEPEQLTLDGSPIGAGLYTIRWEYEDSSGDKDTITQYQLKITSPA